MDSLRLEAGYRALGTDLRGEYSPDEAGLAFAVDGSRQNAIGVAALRNRPVRNRLHFLTFDDEGVMPLGKEPVFSGTCCAGYISSAGFGYSIGQGIAYAHLSEHIDPQRDSLELNILESAFHCRRLTNRSIRRGGLLTRSPGERQAP